MGTSCTFTEPSTGLSQTITLDDLLNLESTTSSYRAVLTRNGITLLEGRGADGAPDYRAYGAWMGHGAFSVETGVQDTTDDGTISVLARGATASGDLAGSRPTASATWHGVMVGTPARGSRRDNLLQGDATLTYHPGRRMLYADFTDIVNLDLNAAHLVPSVHFEDVPVDADGTFGVGGVGNNIRGGFGGPNHVEAAGVFEQQGIVGAFGAKRQVSN